MTKIIFKKINSDQIKIFFRKNWRWGAVVFLVLMAFLIRIWDLKENLYFRLDQSRDAYLVKNVLENGPGELPLLGPRAAGTFLRLGPIFYYFQYFFAFIFQSADPFVFVFPELIFASLSVALFYLLLNQFFSQRTSWLIAILYGFSFIAIQYSRFSWNPNQIPFWALLFIMGLLKIAKEEDPRKAGYWLLVSTIGFGVVSQLHFVALLGFSIVGIIFCVKFFPRKISFRYWVAAFSILALLYLPMMVNEVVTKGANTKQFFYALSYKDKKENESSQKALLEKSFGLHAKYYSLMLSSFGNEEDWFFRAFFFVLVGFFLIEGFGVYWKKDPVKRPLVFLVFVWIMVFGLLYTKLAFTVEKPRFWLMIIFIPFIILAMFFEKLNKKYFLKGKILISVIFLSLLFFNLHAVLLWYKMLNRQDYVKWLIPRDLTLKQVDLVGVGWSQKALDYLFERAQKENKEVCYYTDSNHLRAYKYLFSLKYPEKMIHRISSEDEYEVESCLYFSITNDKRKTKPELPQKYKEVFIVKETKDFGVVRVWELERILEKKEKQTEVKTENSQNESKNREQEKEEELNKLQKEIVRDEDNENDEDEDVEDKEESIEKNEKKPYTERIFWKDVFSN